MEAEEALRTVERALDEAEKMMTHRDRSNAAVHVAPVRYSPLTELVRQARELVPCVGAGLQPPAGAGRRRLVVDVDEVTAQRLERLGAATGTGAVAGVMAAVVLEQYAQTQSVRYCFEHQRDGCGTAQGRHTDTGPEREDSA